MRGRFVPLLLLFPLSVGCATTVVERKSDTAPASPEPTESPTEAPGPTACAEGFTSDEGACIATLPAAACVGSTRASIGSTSCVAIDDCNAPLPEGAIVVSDPSKLQAAIASASPRSTLALEPGTYPGVVVDKPLTIVGRCAERVVFEGSGKGRGIDIALDVPVTLRSLTIRNFELGVTVPKSPKAPAVLDASHVYLSKNRVAISVAGKAILNESVIEGVSSTNDESSGIYAADGGVVEATGIDVRGTVGAIVAQYSGTSVTVRRSSLAYLGAVRDNYLVGSLGGSSVVVEESALRTRSMGVVLASSELAGRPHGTPGATGRVKVRASEVSMRGASGENDMMSVGKSGDLSFEESTVLFETPTAIDAKGLGVVDVQHSFFRAIPNGDKGRQAFMVSGGAKATVGHTVIAGTVRNAVLVGRAGSSFTFDHSKITGVREGVENASSNPMGIALAAMDKATLAIHDSTISDVSGTAVFAGEANLEIARTVIDGVQSTTRALTGIGVLVEDGALSMEGADVRRCGDAALVFLGGEGVVSGNRFSASKVGVHLQDVAVADVERARPNDPNEVVLASNVFEEVGSRLREDRIDVGSLER